MQYYRSPIIRIRHLALNSLRNHRWTPEQQSRIADECLTIMYEGCEA
jgi:hypothetical protein